LKAPQRSVQKVKVRFLPTRKCLAVGAYYHNGGQADADVGLLSVE
jgi:hypothetical protein